MITEPTTTHTFDPADWQSLRQLGHQMLDDMFDLLEHIGEQPVWTKTADEAKAHFLQPLPRQGQPAEAVYDEVKEYILPYLTGNIHPRFFSWVQTSGNPVGMLADMLASAMTPNVTIGDHAAMYVDKQVVNWCKQLLNFPEKASGMLVSGGSMANLTALLVARHAADRQQMRVQGVRATAGALTLYVSAETHSCVLKAGEVMGLGAAGVRKVPVGADYRMDVGTLRTMLAEDRAAGMQPFCIVGNAGTVNTGAIDPLDELADLCTEQGLWFHIDGAFGALAKLSPTHEAELNAIERADSVAFDLHKWLSMPYEVGCALIRDANLHRETFAMTPTYLTKHERGLAAGPDSLSNYGIELSRGFKALKVWMSLKTYGADHMGAVITQNIRQMHDLGDRIAAHPQLDLLTPVTMNIACFRFNPNTGLTTEQLNALNKEILMQLSERGIAAPSYTMLQGHYAIRAANVNHRTTPADLDAMIGGVVLIGNELILSGL